MNTNKKAAGIGSSGKLSALWASLMFLYIYADHISLLRTGQIEEMMAGRMGPFPVTQVSLLLAAILMLVPSVMIFLVTIMRARTESLGKHHPGRAVYAGQHQQFDWATPGFSTSSIGVVEIALTLLIMSGMRGNCRTLRVS